MYASHHHFILSSRVIDCCCSHEKKVPQLEEDSEPDSLESPPPTAGMLKLKGVFKSFNGRVEVSTTHVYHHPVTSAPYPNTMLYVRH